MTLKDLKIGEKFIVNDKSYLKIDFDLNFSLTTRYEGLVCALDLNTYRLVGFSSNEKITRQ